MILPVPEKMNAISAKADRCDHPDLSVKFNFRADKSILQLHNVSNWDVGNENLSNLCLCDHPSVDPLNRMVRGQMDEGKNHYGSTSIRLGARYSSEQAKSLHAVDVSTPYLRATQPTSRLKEHLKDADSVYESLKTAPINQKRQSNMSKSKVNMRLLNGYRCHVEERKNQRGGITTFYIWKYEGCDKEFTRSWSILDHVRMHEGVRPYTCKFCQRSYTQKGNMLKHMRRHTQPNVDSRRSYIWEFCNNG